MLCNHVCCGKKITWISLPFVTHLCIRLHYDTSDYLLTSMHQTTLWHLYQTTIMTHLCIRLPLWHMHLTTYDTFMHLTTLWCIRLPYDIYTSDYLWHIYASDYLWHIYAFDYLMIHLCIRPPYDTSMHQTTLWHIYASDYLDIYMH